MTEAKHTPGPWAVLAFEADRQYLRVRGTIAGFRYKVANVVAPSFDGVSELEAVETLANARLIAAAPELLEALKRTLKHIKWEAACADEVTPGCREDIAHAEAAIAKATGEQA